MKIKIIDKKFDNSKYVETRKFCLFPTRALGGDFLASEFIVWWEWVVWSDTHKKWYLPR